MTGPNPPMDGLDSPGGVVPDRLRLVQIDLPCRVPIATGAIGGLTSRRLLLVELRWDGRTGWGEAAPFPGVSPENVDDCWSALAAAAGRVLSGEAPGELPATASAALDEAGSDLAARLAGVPLWRRLGGTRSRVDAGGVIPLARDPRGLAREVDAAVAEGYRHLKLKIGRDTPPEWIAGVINTVGDVAVGADANGSLDPADDAILRAWDEVGLAYLEQPLPADDLAGSRRCRDRMVTPLCLDESVATRSGLRQVLRREAADIVVIKPGLVGSTGAAEAVALAVTAGVAVKVSGLFESSVGKAHALAVGTLPGVDWMDLSPAYRSLTADVADPGWHPVGGSITVPAAPGIGVEVDEARLGEVTVRDSSFE